PPGRGRPPGRVPDPRLHSGRRRRPVGVRGAPREGGRGGRSQEPPAVAPRPAARPGGRDMTVRLPLMPSLAAHRRAQHLRGSRVAAAIGVAPETLSRWESGQRSPRWALLIAYAAELGRR